MQRRRFLQNSMRGLTGLSALYWLGCASPHTLATESELTLPEGNTPLARAKAAGKPLLVLLVPDTEEIKSMRGLSYGFFVSEVRDKDMALLGLCEVVCATREALARTIPEVTEADWMVLLETDASTPAHRIARPKEGEEPTPGCLSLDELAAMLRGLLLADVAMQRRRVKQCQGALGKAEQAAIAAYLKRPARQPLALFDRGAALLWQAYAQNPPKEEPPQNTNVYFSHQTAAELREASLLRLEEDPGAIPAPEGLVLLVASAAMQRLLQAPPEGSKWETLSLDGCPPCGMGSVPPISRKFLQFLTEPPTAI